MSGYVYILASKKNGTLYIGVTNNLERRLREHKNRELDWFTKKYNIHILVFYSHFETIQEAIEYERKIKWWTRRKKTDLIEKENILRNNLDSSATPQNDEGVSH